jgi:acetylornithine deacetylase/succinyl-diaminopimelate desuccinylase-like protein
VGKDFPLEPGIEGLIHDSHITAGGKWKPAKVNARCRFSGPKESWKNNRRDNWVTSVYLQLRGRILSGCPFPGPFDVDASCWLGCTTYSLECSLKTGLLVSVLLVCHPLHLMAEPTRIERVAAEASVRRGLEFVDAHAIQTAEYLASIAAIISPSGHEHQRAEAVAQRMREIGLQNVSIDDAPNVVGIIPGRSARALTFVSTLDDLITVADLQKAALQPPHIVGDRVVGPGTNTSSTTAAMLASAEALIQAGIKPRQTLVFAAVAQEETGMNGMRRLYAEYKNRASAFVDIMGDGGRITYGAIGIHWWKVVATGPGGHSLSGGLPNVNQAIGRCVDRILSLPYPEQNQASHTIINVAMLQSGAAFNHKPETGWFSLDIRSMDSGTIGKIEADVRGILAQVSKETSIGLSLELVEDTPAGQIPGARESDLVRTSEAIAKYLGLDPVLGDMGSSNANIPIGQGTPAIAISGERGGQRGFADEWADIPVMTREAKEVLLLAVTMAK